MPFRIFTVRPDDAVALDELNRFLGSNRVVGITRHLVRAETDPALLFVVEHLGASASGQGSKSAPKVDYREILSDDEFEVFSALRELRREVAQEVGRPVYAVFSNAELAKMVRERVHTREGLEAIDGIGSGRAEQFAERFLPTLEAWSAKEPATR